MSASEITPTAQRTTIVVACLGWFFSAVDTVLLILFQKEVADSLGAGAQAIRIAIGVGLLGSSVGGFAFAQLGDRIGRVRTLGWSVVLYSLATAGMALAPRIGWLMGFRFLAGIGTGGEWSLGFALIAEVWHRRTRGTLGGIVSAMFNFGTFFAIALYQCRIGWRASFAIMVLPALGVSWLRRRVPESTIWAALQRARATDPAVAAALNRSPLRALFRAPTRTMVAKLVLVFTITNFAFYAFSTLFINFLQETTAQGGLELSAHAQAPFQLVLNLGGLIGLILAGMLSDRWGRRKVFTLFCGVGVLGYAALFALARTGQNKPMLLLVFTIICLSFGIGAVSGSLASELFPTHLRSTGPGVCQNLGKGIGGMLGPTVAGILVPKLGFAPALALPGLCLAALALLIWIVPEVGGREIQPVEEETLVPATRR